MSSFSTFIKLLNEDRAAMMVALIEKLGIIIPDKLYLSLIYKYTFKRQINLSNPKSFNEKLQWLKLYNRKPEYTTLVDKFAVKEYVANIVGEKYVIPTLGVWSNPKEIDWNSLPQQFVLKTTHGGGNYGVIICKNKDIIDKGIVIKKLKKSLKQNIYKSLREWPYKNIKRRIIAEPYMEDNKTEELRDYKFFCFDGEVKALFIGSQRQKREEPYFDFFDDKFNHLPIKQGHPNSPVLPEKPACFEEMKTIASKLSKGFPHVRIDLYEANEKVYFGEITFYHFGGLVPFEPNTWDYEFGKWITLPMCKINAD